MPDILLINQVLRVWFGQITLELCIPSHIRQVRASLRVMEKRFGEENNELYKDCK
jgi:hypothetical protein